MNILAPVLGLAACFAAIMLLAQIRPGIGFAWLLSVFTSLAITIFYVFLRWRLPSTLVIDNWLPGAIPGIPLAFQLDYISWSYSFGFVVLLFAVILTSSVRLQNQSSPFSLAGSIGIVAIGLLAIQAVNPISLIVCWAILDLVELTIEVSLGERKALVNQAIVAYAFRTGGVLLAILAVLYSRNQGILLTLTSIPPQAAFILVVSVGLRLGVIPLHLPFIQESQNRRGLGDVLRMASPLSSFVLLARLPAGVVSQDVTQYIVLIAAWAAIYASARWLAAEDELVGRPFWLISFASLAVVCAIQGDPGASRAWGTVMLTSGSVLFLFPARQGKLWLIPGMGLLSMSGLPFSPAASGWYGIYKPGWSWYHLAFLVSHSMLMTGYLRHILRKGESMSHLERWIHVVYPIGLSLMVLAGWVLGVLGWEGSFRPGVWWAGVSSVLLFLMISLLIWLFQREKPENNISLLWVRVAFIRLSGFLGRLFSLNWLFRVFQIFYSGVERLIQAITVILEGDGGVIWALIMLALFISLLRSFGS